jgi:hypothetical protein
MPILLRTFLLTVIVTKHTVLSVHAPVVQMEKVPGEKDIQIKL